jgi:glucose/arabinose dehydrogenase
MPASRLLPLVLFTLLLPAVAEAQNPNSTPPNPAIPWDASDLGPFHSGCFKFKIGSSDQVTAKGVAIKVDKAAGATVLFDTELLRWTAAWTGGFIQFPRGRGGLEGPIKPAGDLAFSTGQVPGWGGGATDPRQDHQGNLDSKAAKWRGLYVSGDSVVLSYTIGATPVLELPGYDATTKAFTRTISTSGFKEETALLLGELPGGRGRVGTDGTAIVEAQAEGGNRHVLAVALSATPVGTKLEVIDGRVSLNLPRGGASTFGIALWSGAKSDLVKTSDLAKAAAPKDNLASLTKGGPPHWGAPLVTQGKLSNKPDAYVIDEITLPDDNPFKSWLRLGGHDFFPDGKAAIVNISGDVWIVDGLDDKLDKVTWKRFATGLFQPLGCKVADGKIYVLGRDQITRLHDVNNDGEADFYECFNNDCVVTDNYHEFALDLLTDRAGNFYYAKGSPWEPTVTSPHQGCLMKVSKDGSKLEILATGLRAPNGLGIGPEDQLTVSDNQGHWMPANRINLIKPGGFYGMVPAAHKELTFARPDGTTFKANPSTEAARQEFKTRFWGTAAEPIPTEMEPPIVWLPMNVDNSPGGEVWVPPGNKWGPLGGQMLHLSYGHCVLYNVLQELVGDSVQGAVVKLAGKFPSGIMRGRFSPKDGQLYVTGLNVWQSDAARFGCFSRVRFTGMSIAQPVGIKTSKSGVSITFTAELDPTAAADRENWSVERWNYKWTGQYGSKDFSVADPTKAIKDLVFIDTIKLSADRRTVTLDLPDMGPANQVKITYRIKSADGKDISNQIYQTINKIPGGVALR